MRSATSGVVTRPWQPRLLSRGTPSSRRDGGRPRRRRARPQRAAQRQAPSRACPHRERSATLAATSSASLHGAPSLRRDGGRPRRVRPRRIAQHQAQSRARPHRKRTPWPPCLLFRRAAQYPRTRDVVAADTTPVIAERLHAQPRRGRDALGEVVKTIPVTTRTAQTTTAATCLATASVVKMHNQDTGDHIRDAQGDNEP